MEVMRRSAKDLPCCEELEPSSSPLHSGLDKWFLSRLAGADKSGSTSHCPDIV